MTGNHPGLEVLFADNHLLVLNKPAGLLAVPGRGPDKQDCLSARAQAAWPDALVVHRLDMATSGLVVMARGIDAQRSLSLAFEKRRVYKRYVAVVCGALLNPLPDNDWGTIDLPLLLDWLNRPRSIVSLETGKPSQTRWRLSPQLPAENPQAHTGIATRVELEPITGRSHQLRVHLQAIGHPIVGDTLYAPLDAPAKADRLLLHAQAIEVPHPFTGERLLFESPCPF
ncbi:RNA pseudouridine synthase [Hydrogenophaga crassostreae]|uniref:Dual-specificity RNA pseudouridine synthase RluA n=1 Tax=Hydrogenophaga crassostreae TaxID=1763535 RepID=A0A167H8K0_9BURK|nr:RluA family pseudouridine synthase [Hydrogenophaga crassostreae]AOW12618.1 RNA pseudouridine synthase [Hydrogenophaga crassostreae]OAD40488.1 RNA pseudouridine synthase [Hydrogenophaga crassostreae]